MEQGMHTNFKAILMSELMPALGCTEPIAIALASAKAREVLGDFPEEVTLYCSGNIIKNVKGVTVPNSGGLKGIDIAACLGICGGESSKKLQVLEGLSEQDIGEARLQVGKKLVKVVLVEGEENLYLRAELRKGIETASVEIKYDHTRFYRIMKNGVVLFEDDIKIGGNEGIDKSALSLKNILDYADYADLHTNTDLTDLLDLQIAYNSAIADEGLNNKYGAQVGRTLMASGNENDPQTRAKARTAAGSDARMSGCNLPVVINSGSGNQGMTVSIPVIEFAQALQVPKDTLYRALLVSNLVAIHQKRFIGRLSAFCGVVSASAAAGAGIGYLHGYGYKTISSIIVNTIATTGGMVCDGAKPSCASKIAMALDNVLMAINMSKQGRTFLEGEGLVGSDVEETIENVGRMAKVGMKATDLEILKIMIHA